MIKIIQHDIVEHDLSLDEVINDRLALLRGLESKRGIFRRIGYSQGAASAVIARREPFGFSLFPPSLQFFRLADTPVRVPCLEQLHGMATIQIHPLRLAERAFVPIEPDPFHPIDDGVNRFVRRAALIGIFDTENKHALLLASKEPIEQGRSHAAYVEKSRRTGSKADTNLTHDRATLHQTQISRHLYHAVKILAHRLGASIS